KGTLRERLRTFAGNEWDDEIEAMFDYLDLFSDRKITVAEGTPAQLLQVLLEEKWRLAPGDKDMIVMEHQFHYTIDDLPGVILKLKSSLVVTGKDQTHTAMAMTVGLPLAITVKNFLTGGFELSGVQLPTKKEIYEPMLRELEVHG